MPRKTIADHMVDILNETGFTTVWMGSIDLIHDCADRANVTKDHPLKTINSVLNALDRSNKFEKGYIRATALTGTTDRTCKYRSFKLKT